jgi:hypothetical protein
MRRRASGWKSLAMTVVRPAAGAALAQAGSPGAGGAGVGTVSRALFRPECAAFHEKLGEQHGIQLSYTWVKQAQQGPDWWPRGASAGFIASGASDGRCPACCCISTAAGIAGCRAAFLLSVKGTYRFDFRLLLRGLKITPRSQWMFSHRMSLAGYVQRVHQVTARGETE